MRKEFKYPPYRHLIRHLFRGRSLAKVEFYTEKWAFDLVNESKLSQITLKGSAPAPIEKNQRLLQVSSFLFYEFSKECFAAT